MEIKKISPNDFDETKLNESDFQNTSKKFSLEFAKFNSLVGIFGDLELFFNCIEEYADQLSHDRQVDFLEGLIRNESYCHTKYSMANQYKGSTSFNLDEHNIRLNFFKLMLERIQNPSIQSTTTEAELPEIDLRTQREQIRLMYDLGLLHFLKQKYPNALRSNNKLAELIGKILKLERSTIVSTVNAIMNETTTDRNYPKQTANTNSIIDYVNSYEKI